MRVCIGADHGGYKLKCEIVKHLKAGGYDVIDMGAQDETSCDYPDYAVKVCDVLLKNGADKGILVCGTGIGISISANKINGIRCALLSDVFSAKATREHNDANVMALGARVVAGGLACEIIDAFLTTAFSGEERHQRRIDKITALEN